MATKKTMIERVTEEVQPAHEPPYNVRVFEARLLAAERLLQELKVELAELKKRR